MKFLNKIIFLSLLIFFTMIGSGEVKAVTKNVCEHYDTNGGHVAITGCAELVYDDEILYLSVLDVGVNYGLTCSWDTEIDEREGQLACESSTMSGFVDFPNLHRVISADYDNSYGSFNNSFVVSAMAGTYYLPTNVNVSDGVNYNAPYTVIKPPQCSDGIDNDGDGTIDGNDNGCYVVCIDSDSYVPSDDSENSDCTPTVTLTPRWLDPH